MRVWIYSVLFQVIYVVVPSQPTLIFKSYFHAGRMIIDCVKVGRNPCPNAFKRGPCVNIDLLLNPREYWPLIGQSGFKSSCSDG